MKRLADILVVLLLTTGLAACGGGGGGGSSPNADNEIFSYSYNGMVLENGLVKTEDGLEIILNLPGTGIPDAFKRNVVISLASDFSRQGDFMVGSKDTNTTLNNAEIDGDFYTGDLTITDKVYLGGKGAGLQYSEFGAWKVHYAFNGTVGGSQQNFTARDEDMAFFKADETKRASFPADLSAALSFTGTAVGMYIDEWAPGGPQRMDITGTAAVTIPAGAFPSSHLKIDFTNVAVIDIHNAVTPTGGFNDYVASYSVTVHDTSGLDPIHATFLIMDGYFYGPSADNPTEAAGTFKIGNSSDDRSIIGAFGVKKN